LHEGVPVYDRGDYRLLSTFAPRAKDTTTTRAAGREVISGSIRPHDISNADRGVAAEASGGSTAAAHDKEVDA